MGEEDVDLEELRKAIRSGDKERAESLAVTLLKKRGLNPNVFKNPSKENPPTDWLPIILGVGATLGIIVLSFLEMWFTHKEKKKKEEMQYV